ncbi:TPA_asm: hypothetical protein [Porphyromonas phage phage028a_KCOM2799]|uniref:Uncharacterized protein n=1 Tax=Porphyromonas phage phage028a_KCOM2799 TaxID=3154118 RepID=A0AAT9JNP0_9CAUD
MAQSDFFPASTVSSTKSFLLCVGRFVVKVISSRRRSGEQ